MTDILTNHFVTGQDYTEKAKAIRWNFTPLVGLNFFCFSKTTIIFCKRVKNLTNFLLCLKGPHRIDDSHRKDQDKKDSQGSNCNKLKSQTSKHRLLLSNWYGGKSRHPSHQEC